MFPLALCFFALWAFLRNLLLCRRSAGRRSATTLDFDIEAGRSTIPGVEVAEAKGVTNVVHPLNRERVGGTPTRMKCATQCFASASRVKIHRAQKNFLPPELAAAIERYGGVTETQESAYVRGSDRGSTGTDISDARFFSEEESVAGSLATSFGEFEEEDSRRARCRIQSAVEKDVEQPVFTSKEKREDGALNRVPETVWEDEEKGEVKYEGDTRDTVEIGKKPANVLRSEPSLVVATKRKADAGRSDPPDTDLPQHLERRMVFGNLLEFIRRLDNGPADKTRAFVPVPRCGVTGPVPSDIPRCPSLSTIPAEPPRPLRSSDHKPTETPHFVDRSNIGSRPLPPIPLRSNDHKPTGVPNFVNHSCIGSRPLPPIPLRSGDHKPTEAPNFVNRLDRGARPQPPIPASKAEAMNSVPRAVVWGPRSRADPPWPRATFKEALARTLAVKSRRDFGLPTPSRSAVLANPQGEEVVPIPTIVVQSPSLDAIHPEPFRPLRGCEDDAFMEDPETSTTTQKSVPGNGIEAVRPIPIIVVQSPSLDEIYTGPVRPAREEGEDPTQVLEFMRQHDYVLPDTGKRTWICQDMGTTDPIDLSREGVDLLDPPDSEPLSGYEAVFDIIGNYGVPFEIGQEFFVRASECIVRTAAENELEPDSAPCGETVPSFGDRRRGRTNVVPVSTLRP